MTPPYHPPVKYSVRISGHRTSISLEPVFWDLLTEAAAGEGCSINTLVAAIDAERIQADPAPGLASAIRIWLLQKERGAGPVSDAPCSENPVGRDDRPGDQ